MTAPAAGVPKEARAFQGQRAGLATRALAGVLDGIVLVAMLVGTYAAFAAGLFLWDPPRFHFPAPSRPVVVLTAYLFCLVYLTLSWRITGRTYGDQVMGLRVLGRRGRPPGIVVSLARAVLCVVFPLGLLWAAVSRENRAVADLLLRTLVIYDWRSGPAGVVNVAAPPSATRSAPPAPG